MLLSFSFIPAVWTGRKKRERERGALVDCAKCVIRIMCEHKKKVEVILWLCGLNGGGEGIEST